MCDESFGPSLYALPPSLVDTRIEIVFSCISLLVSGSLLIVETPIGMIFLIDVNQNLDLVSFF